MWIEIAEHLDIFSQLSLFRADKYLYHTKCPKITVRTNRNANTIFVEIGKSSLGIKIDLNIEFCDGICYLSGNRELHIFGHAVFLIVRGSTKSMMRRHKHIGYIYISKKYILFIGDEYFYIINYIHIRKFPLRYLRN